MLLAHLKITSGEIIVIRFAFLATTVLFTQYAFCAEPRVVKVGEKPESVCRGFDGKLYVTIIDGEQPGDGGINVVDGDAVSEFCRGMNSPKGIAFVGSLLVVADETTVWAVDAKGSMHKIAEKDDFPSPIEFLNDVAAAPDGEGVYVSEMSHPKWMFDPTGQRKLWPVDSDHANCPQTGCVYRVGLDGKVSLAVPAGGKLTGPNGVAVRGKGDDAKIVTGDFFTGNILQYDGSEQNVIASGMRGADGIEFSDGVMFVSSWPLGKVWSVDLESGKNQLLSDDFTTAADLFYDSVTGQVIVPDMLEGTLTFLPLD